MKPSISEAGNGHGCERAIGDLGHPHAGLLAHLARDGLLEALARLDEPGQRAVAARRPRRAWRPRITRSPSCTSMITTGSVRGWCSVPQRGQRRMWPASRLSVGAPQFEQKRWRRCQFSSATRVGEQPAVGLREHRGQVAQAAALAGEVVARVGGEERAAVAVDAEEHELEAVGGQLVEARTAAGARRATTTPASAGDHDARGGIGEPRGQPRLVAPVRPGAVERLAGERVRASQAAANRWRPCARSARAPARRSPRAP